LEDNKDIKILSLGTGRTEGKFEGDTNGRNLNTLKELGFLEAFIFELDTAVTNFNLKYALNDKFVRL
jgi:hypothetical protein